MLSEDELRDQTVLGQMLTERYRETGNLDALTAAIDIFDAMDAATGSYPLRPVLRQEQAVRLRHRATTSGQNPDLERAISLLEHLLEDEAEGTYMWMVPASTLAVCLGQRFRRLGYIEDLDRAIDLHQKVLRVRHSDAIDVAGHMLNLGTSLLARWLLHHHRQDLDDAIGLLRTALRQYCGPPSELPGFLADLATALSYRAGLEDGGEEDAQAAEQLFAAALSACSRGSSIEALAIAGLSEMIARRARSRTEAHAIDADIRNISSLHTAARRHVKIAADVSARLAEAKVARHRLTRRTADLADAARAYRHCVETDAGDPVRLLTTATDWAEWAESSEAWDSAAEAFGHVLTAIRALVALQYRRSDKETWIARAPYLADQAAYAFASVEANDLEAAVRAAEEGRALLMREALRERTEPEALRLAGYENLAALLERTERRLTLARASGSAEQLAEAVSAHRAALSEARATGACQPVADPVGIGEIRAAATCSGTALVYLLSARGGGMALVVPPDDVTIHEVRLPEARLDEVHRRAEHHLQGYEAYKRDRSAEAAWLRALEELGEWCWTAVIGPVTEVLPKGSPLTLLPGGPLRFLPLHMAHTPKDDHGRSTYAGDDRLICFAPGAAALLASEEPVSLTSVTLVCAPGTRAPLRYAPLETDEVHKRHPHATRLDGARAGTAETLAHLARTSLVHLACHATADLREPLNGGLELTDGRLRLRDILRQRGDVGVLAVLSACETAMTGTALPNEAIGLPTGLLQAGFRGVIGSHWIVDDMSTALLMARFHDLLNEECPHPGEALRQAQRWLREATNEEIKATFPAYRRDTTTMSPLARRLWKKARPYSHPFHWSSMSFTGSWPTR
ncbi:CHAT domain-containing protein [Streptomyces sp. NPDC048045]|uniref:CHAT domain-containing protein n=1 Tax=Streptomyces sp. NPDC048045 TaxID=3154710 RepID=UPI003447E47D